MDKNTVIGLTLIGSLLVAFSIFNKPSQEELDKQKAKAEKELVEKKEDKDNNDKKASVAKGDSDNSKIENIDVVTDSTLLEEETNEYIEPETIVLENEKLRIQLSTLGGQVERVDLKEFETYDNFMVKDAPDVALTLFQEGDASNGLEFEWNKKIFRSAEEMFTIKSQSKDKVVFSWQNDAGQEILYTYKIKANQYDLDYDITLKGFDGEVSPNNVLYNWDVSMRKTERLLSEQRRVSTVCFNYDEEGFSYLSEMGDDNEIAEDDIEWISFKQSYFSTFLSSKTGFSKEGSKFEISGYNENSKEDSIYIKDYSTKLNLNISNTENATVNLNWFFGPNDYKVLKSYDAGYDNVLNYGWGLFRWINLYAVQPVFNFLTSTGMGVGIAILLLTLLIKTFLMPIQWKMYTSSAKMRILKPEIEEIAKKYPEKEDAMKKQMETMTLYRESGASPLAGCVPMLIQMPILLAVFRFFPSTFDLRQKSFLWAEDLSSYDSIWDFGFNVWLYGDHVSLFTLLMAATTLIYTIINSGNMQTPQQPGMPNMKYIMYFFPIMMIFFFNNYSSGLSYYYFISTLTSIVIMLLIKKFFVDEEKLKLKMANRKSAAATNPKKKGKSKFQERLEQMQKKQQEQLKNRKK